MTVTFSDLPDDVLQCIGACIVPPDRPIVDSARDCAAVAMACKAFLPIAVSAWERLAEVAECHPNLPTLSVQWRCVHRQARRQHVYKLARNLPRQSSGMTVSSMDAMLDEPGLVGASCPIPTKAARYLLDVSWLPISRNVALERFWDRDLSACEKLSPCTLRYRTVVNAPVRPGPAVSARLTELRAFDTKQRARGLAREWGDTDIPRILRLEELRAWVKEGHLPAALTTSFEAEFRRNGVFSSETRQKAVRLASLLSDHGFESEAIGASGHFDKDVMVAFARGAQKKILGEVVFHCHHLAHWSDADVPFRFVLQPVVVDVTSLLAHLRLAAECRAQADSLTLASYARYAYDLRVYIRLLSQANAIREAREGLAVMLEEHRLY